STIYGCRPLADRLSVHRAKSTVTDQGGKITHEFKLIKGFTAEFPDGTVHSMESNEHVTVEADSEVKTQYVA
ncbi:hypothetical protein K490DRAFT_37075, partial [Saccharata proteae CBS 121410]